MYKSELAPQVDDHFIDNKIERAYHGISYIKVKNTGKFYANLKGKEYSFSNALQNYRGTRTLKAAKSIFKGLISKYQCFESDGIYYHINVNTGKWMWSEI
ncbi:hypothetical protein [Aquimarina sp. 2201CG5-10]|uniref:hypothetical protein n=1 Tax=Aquimarina callyspongiae TaxID=3098150 RepID=UPI002AB41C49|nr:hypothetical protein [Aquimarina sp. 2201CG5-10]MDY8137576.1 hypothetical protein [Aquimarina sp. 2201CG5-10]